MSSRNYGTAFDTEYNKRIHDELLRMEMSKNDSGQPDNLVPQRLVGGGIPDGKYFRQRGDYSDHPHLVHPLLGASGGEGGRFSFGKLLKGVGREIAPIAKSVGKDLLKDAIKGAVTGGAISKNGFVDPHGGMSTPRYVQAGHQSTYPFYNQTELSSIDTRGGAEGGRFSFGKLLKGVGREIAPIAKDVGKDLLKDAIKGAVTGAGKRRGRPKKVKEEKMVTAPKKRGRPKKSDIEGGKFNLGKALKTVGKEIKKTVVKDILPEAKKQGKKMAKKALKDLGDSALTAVKESVRPSAPMEGSGKVDGRKRRAEIVKKIMKEKGMKMTDASRYVKEKGLYKP